jgi:protein-S-isoprenylcysteine O-methyltransferase Ste14
MPDTKLRCVAVERFLGSFGFSLLLFLLWGTLTAFHGRSLLERFDCIELFWFVYVLKHPSWYHGALFLLVTFLYIKRALFEEEIMSSDERYTEYMKKVRCRFIPGLF